MTSEPGSDWRAPAGSGSRRFAAGSCCRWSLRLGGTVPRRGRRAPRRAVRGCRSAAFYEERNPPLLPPGWHRPSAVRGGRRRGGKAERAGGAAGGARDSVRAGGRFCGFSGRTSLPLLPQLLVGFLLPEVPSGRWIEKREGRQPRAPGQWCWSRWGGTRPGAQVKQGGREPCWSWPRSRVRVAAGADCAFHEPRAARVRLG